MSIAVVFKIAGIGILVAIICCGTTTVPAAVTVFRPDITFF